MRRFVLGFYISMIVVGASASADIVSAEAPPATFTVASPDYKLSPYTGMTRSNWIDAAKYLLQGAFSHVKSLDDPMYFNRMGEVCYPKDESNRERVRGATLEGMARTLFMASPLIREDSTVAINGIRLADD